jgi:hypothetical protein
MTQEEEDLVDPQDDVELEAQRKQKETLQEKEEDKVNDQDKAYDSDAGIVDPREESELSREQEEEEIIAKEDQAEKHKSKKKKETKVAEPTPKVKEKVKKKKIPYPNRVQYKPNKDIYNSFAVALSNLRLELPLADAIQVLTYKKFMRDILNRKKKGN